MRAPRGPLAELFGSEADRDAPPPDPVELLGWMLQLPGTVRMSAMLDDHPPPPRPDDPGAAAGAGADVPRWRLRHLQSLALRPLADPLSGRHALAGPARARELLAELGLLGRRRRARVDEIANQIAGPFHQMLRNRIAVVRAGVDELRRELGPSLQQLGPASAYLVELEGALRASTEERARQLFDRAQLALHQRFREGLWRAAAELSEDLPPGEIEAWYESGGWIDDHVGACRSAVRSVCRHEGRALEHWMTAARAVATVTESPS